LKKNVYYIVKNTTDEDVDLEISLVDGGTVSDTFRAQEVASGLTRRAAQLIHMFDPYGEVFHIQRVEEEVRSEWRDEGF